MVDAVPGAVRVLGPERAVGRMQARRPGNRSRRGIPGVDRNLRGHSGPRARDPTLAPEAEERIGRHGRTTKSTPIAAINMRGGPSSMGHLP
jgi:hypothetical protein